MPLLEAFMPENLELVGFVCRNLRLLELGMFRAWKTDCWQNGVRRPPNSRGPFCPFHAAANKVLSCAAVPFWETVGEDQCINKRVCLFSL